MPGELPISRRPTYLQKQIAVAGGRMLHQREKGDTPVTRRQSGPPYLIPTTGPWLRTYFDNHETRLYQPPLYRLRRTHNLKLGYKAGLEGNDPLARLIVHAATNKSTQSPLRRFLLYNLTVRMAIKPRLRVPIRSSFRAKALAE